MASFLCLIFAYCVFAICKAQEDASGCPDNIIATTDPVCPNLPGEWVNELQSVEVAYNCSDYTHTLRSGGDETCFIDTDFLAYDSKTNQPMAMTFSWNIAKGPNGYWANVTHGYTYLGSYKFLHSDEDCYMAYDCENNQLYVVGKKPEGTDKTSCNPSVVKKVIKKNQLENIKLLPGWGSFC